MVTSTARVSLRSTLSVFYVCSRQVFRREGLRVSSLEVSEVRLNIGHKGFQMENNYRNKQAVMVCSIAQNNLELRRYRGLWMSVEKSFMFYIVLCEERSITFIWCSLSNDQVPLQNSTYDKTDISRGAT